MVEVGHLVHLKDVFFIRKFGPSRRLELLRLVLDCVGLEDGAAPFD